MCPVIAGQWQVLELQVRIELVFCTPWRTRVRRINLFVPDHVAETLFEVGEEVSALLMIDKLAEELAVTELRCSAGFVFAQLPRQLSHEGIG